MVCHALLYIAAYIEAFSSYGARKGQMTTDNVPACCNMRFGNEKLQLQFLFLQLQFFGKLQLQFCVNQQNTCKSYDLSCSFLKNCSCRNKNCNCSFHCTFARRTFFAQFVGLGPALSFWDCLPLKLLLNCLPQGSQSMVPPTAP